jgi:malonyl-CoA O-methyltransferase/biotin synthesis protein BioG
MIIRKIKAKGDSRSLLLFFAGWGMDERPFLEYLPSDRDCMICYDYRSLAFDGSMLAPYGEIRAVAWSMGVWAAARTLSGRHVTESIAINGTPWPVDDERGIATAIFRGTLDGLNENTLQKFRRRMCGSKEAFLHFMEHAPRRTVEDLREELEQIGNLSAGDDSPPFAWDCVYIGSHDKIFLPDNQRKAWEGERRVMVECEHFPSILWNKLFSDAK